jgi:glycosyltransferase involved in cell wall biosynthesis
MPKVFLSVLIDTYNHERFIEEAVLSVLGQDFPASDREILVVDDGSTDRTPEILAKFLPDIRILRKPNGGQASAFNYAIPECRGEIISMLDGDDWWAKDKLRSIAPIFESQPDIGAVGHGYFMVDVDGKLQSTVVPKQTRRLHARTAEDAALFARHGGFFGTSKVAYRKKILDRILPIPERVIIEADEWMFTLVPCLTDVLALDLPLFYYRLHGGNMFLLSAPADGNLKRLYGSLACLTQNLPPKMRELGIPVAIDESLLAHLRLQTEQLRIQLEGGSRWEVLRLQRATNRFFVAKSPLFFRVFKQIALLLALALPAKQFLRLKSWYGASRLRRMRKWIGEPVHVSDVIERPFQQQ